jgi:PAS domain S-box-containing protein
MKKANALSEKEDHDHHMRKKAEEKLANMPSLKEMAGIKTDELIHELQVHQIELEMQNEELKKAQIDLENSKEKYIDLYDFAPVGYFTFSREGLIKEVNLTGATLLGITRTKLIDRGFGKFVVPSDFKLWNDHLVLSQLLKDGEKQSCELSLKCEDRSRIFVRLESVRIEKMDVTLQVRTAVSDITRSKRVEEALNKSQSLLAETAVFGNVGGWEFNIDTKKQIWTQETYKIFELDLTYEPTVENGIKFCAPASRPIIERAVERAIKYGESYDVELEIITARGNLRSIHVIGKADLEHRRVCGFFQDITQLKLAEKERIQLIKSELEARAEAESARNLDQMKSMFIASTSHELKSPLNSIIGFTSMILDGISGELNPSQKTQLEIVHSSGKHLLSLINDIIDSSRIDAGKIDLKISEFNIRTVVDEAILTLGVQIKERRLKISQDVEDITMKTDRLRLLQCVLNLIINAVKYTEKGTIKIIVKTKENRVYITVIDTGIGIKTEDIPKLFAPFVRLQTPLTSNTSGTGLGLYLVKKITKDFLGGEVDVESEFGVGSKFTLNIPIELEGKV